MVKNVMATVITTEMPKMIANEQVIVYVPIASGESYGAVKIGDLLSADYYLSVLDGVIDVDISKIRPLFVEKVPDRNVVYGTGNNGETTYPISKDAVQNAVVQRSVQGNIVVPLNPPNDNHAVPKRYVDNLVADLEQDDAKLGRRIDGVQADLNVVSGEVDDLQQQLIKENLLALIGNATNLNRGLMTPTQVANLETLVALLRDDDDDDMINTIQEVLNAFASSPEGTDIANALANKLPLSHDVSPTAHPNLFTKDNLSNVIGPRTTTSNGLMTPKDVNDISNKVEKASLPAMVYATDEAASDIAIPYDTGAKGGSIVIRDENGTFEVSEPSEKAHPVTLWYYEKKSAADYFGLGLEILEDRRRISRLEQGLVSDVFETDASIAYMKDVPQNALTYASVSKIGGMTYRDAETNTLKNAKVDVITSLGPNLIPYPYNFRDHTESGITVDVNNDGGVTYDGTATNQINSCYTDSLFLPKGTYTLSGAPEGSIWTTHILIVQTQDYSTTLAVDDGDGTTFTLDKDTLVRICFVIASGVTCSNVTVYPMLNRGTTALPYEKYKSHKIARLVIPKDVRELDGYGQGISEEYCNYIDWRPGEGVKNFVQKTKVKVFDGTETWNFITNNDMHVAQFTYITRGNTGVCNRFPYGDADTIRGTFEVSNVGFRFNVDDLNITTKAEWLALLAQWNDEGNPLTVVHGVYDGRDPIIVTDISAVLSDDNVIEVQDCGVIIAENENNLAVPTTITYQLKEVSE